MFKSSIVKSEDIRQSQYGTFNNDAGTPFTLRRTYLLNVFTFDKDAETILYTIYPCVEKAEIDQRKKLALQISSELRNFAPHLGVDISIIYEESHENSGFNIVLRDPENIGSSFFVSYNSDRRRSYENAQLNVIRAFFTSKLADIKYKTLALASVNREFV